MPLNRIFRYITITIVVFLAVFFYQADSLYQRSLVAQQQMTHSRAIIGRLRNVSMAVLQLQGVRSVPLEPAARGILLDTVRRNMDTLFPLTARDPVQHREIEQFAATVHEQLSLLAPGPRPPVQQQIDLLGDSLKIQSEKMITQERARLTAYTSTFDYYNRSRYIFAITTFVLLSIFLFISLYYIYRNFTKRLLAERLARANEEKYRLLIEGSQFTTAIITKDKTIKFISANIEQLTGQRKEDLTGRKLANIDIPGVEEWKAHPERTFMDVEMTVDFAGKGELKWIAYRIFPLHNDAGEINEWQIVAWDINTEKRMEEELSIMLKHQTQQQALMQNIIDNIPSAIYIKDIEGRYVIVNKKLCDLWHFLPADILGRKDVEVFPTSDRSSYQEVDEKVLQYKSMVTQEQSIVRNGKKEYYWVVKFPLLDDQGNVENICGVATDITDRKENELKLIHATRVAESSRIAQESFLANMSHEIRTPMNGIMGMSNLLLSTRQTGEQQEYAENILESARHLLAIINDILDFSKIKAGKFQFEHVAFKPRHAIKKAIYPLQFKADEKLVKLTLDMDDNVPEGLVGDALRLQQIIINLVGNALKFTENGSVQIAARCRESDDGFCLLEVLVKDTGIGIAQDKLQMIFESFTQNNVNTSRKYGGTGLGLAIVKQLVELQNGRVWVESVPKEGSTFGFTIPYKVGEITHGTTTLQQAIGMEDSRILTGIKVLVAEDNLINQKVVNITLSKQGATVDVVNNGQLAVDALLKDGSYDVVLMDLQMPELDGYKATRIIRKEIDGTIPIIAMTADALKGEAERCFEAGMNGYISKPFEPKELYQEILKFVKKFPRMQSQEANNPAPVDLTYLYDLAGNDPGYINEVLDLFLGTMPEGLKQLEQLIRDTRDTESIYRQAHFLKSSVSVVHIRDMFDNLSKIEALAQQQEDKSKMIPVLDEMLATFELAHPMLLAEKVKHKGGKI